MRIALRLTKREKVLIILLSVIACMFVYFRLVFLPEMSRYEALVEEFNEKSVLLDYVNNKKEHIDQINKEIDLLDEEMSGKRNKLSKPLFLPDVLEDLHVQSIRYGVTIDNIAFSGAATDIIGTFNYINDTKVSIATPEDGESPQMPADLAVSFSFVADYDNLMDFIRHYEEGQRYTVIEILDMRNIEDKFSGTMTMRFYMIR